MPVLDFVFSFFLSVFPLLCSSVRTLFFLTVFFFFFLFFLSGEFCFTFSVLAVTLIVLVVSVLVVVAVAVVVVAVVVVVVAVVVTVAAVVAWFIWLLVAGGLVVWGLIFLGGGLVGFSFMSTTVTETAVVLVKHQKSFNNLPLKNGGFI